jgi:D-glycero-D-manno-heptose 1,7-bisphosphate phosphatase
MLRPAVFLDKDGTIVTDVPYNVDPARITLAPRAGAALRDLSDAGFALVVISNQSGVARGLFEETALDAVENRLRDLLAEYGVRLLDFRYCPHHPDGKVVAYARECKCRKPQPGMLLGAAAEHGIDLMRSWMIGDILDDVEAGRRAGCKTILVDTGSETQWREGPGRRPHHVVADIRRAASTILQRAATDETASGTR